MTIEGKFGLGLFIIAVSITLFSFAIIMTNQGKKIQQLENTIKEIQYDKNITNTDQGAIE